MICSEDRFDERHKISIGGIEFRSKDDRKRGERNHLVSQLRSKRVSFRISSELSSADVTLHQNPSILSLQSPLSCSLSCPYWRSRRYGVLSSALLIFYN